MAFIAYASFNFREGTLLVIERANKIIEEYVERGFRLTLRQLYYQFVSRGWLPNEQNEYKRLGSIVNDGRMAGLIDWDVIEDRGRNLLSLATWVSPASIVSASAQQFRMDLWAGQKDYVEVWVEKEALVGVVAVPCERWRVPFFACKGYASQSEVWSAGHHRMRKAANAGKRLSVLHLGDHDPSGIDMTRDVRERLTVFSGRHVDVLRLALNMDQVEEHRPPPNPAKLTDSRFGGYSEFYGDQSWELDALDPEMIAELIEGAILDRLDLDKWERGVVLENEHKEDLASIASSYDDVAAFIAARRIGGT